MDDLSKFQDPDQQSQDIDALWRAVAESVDDVADQALATALAYRCNRQESRVFTALKEDYQ